MRSKIEEYVSTQMGSSKILRCDDLRETDDQRLTKSVKKGGESFG